MWTAICTQPCSMRQTIRKPISVCMCRVSTAMQIQILFCTVNDHTTGSPLLQEFLQVPHFVWLESTRSPVITIISGEQLRMVFNNFLFSFPNAALCRSEICTIRYPSRSSPSFSDSYVYVVSTRCLFWYRQNGISIMIISIRIRIFLCGIFFIFIYSRSQITAPIFYLSSLPCDTSCL